MRTIFKFLLLFLVLCMIYKPEFVFIPRSINSFFGVLGFMIYWFDQKGRKEVNSHTDIRFGDVGKCYIPVLIMTVFSCLMNASTDFTYITYFISIFFAFYANYLIARLSHKIYGQFTLSIFFKYLIFAELVYLFLSLLMFIQPSANDMLLSLLRKDDLAKVALERTEGLRIQGFGASYFGAGIVNGLFLIFLAIYTSMRSISTKERVLYYLLYCFVFVVGMMQARTTIVGAALGIWVMLCCSKGIKNWLRIAFTFILVIAVSVASFDLIARSVSFDIDTLYKFAFELFINYAENGEATTSSTNRLWEFYDIIPTDFKTWLIGDAKLSSDKGGYYMYTDVGYFRYIFYFGVIGMLLMFLFNFQIFKLTILRNQLFGKYSKMMVYILFVYTLILNVKGIADLTYLVYPLFFVCKQVDLNVKQFFNEEV